MVYKTDRVHDLHFTAGSIKSPCPFGKVGFGEGLTLSRQKAQNPRQGFSSGESNIFSSGNARVTAMLSRKNILSRGKLFARHYRLPCKTSSQ
jgi:hypothetical protein